MKNNLLNSLGFILLSALLFGSGFYFGYKNNQAKAEGLTASKDEISKLADYTEKNQSSLEEKIVKNIDGVFWIKAGSDPTCPENYPIKGKFDSSVNVYYNKDNQFYNRVKAQVCFATEEFARDQAGFVKKF